MLDFEKIVMAINYFARNKHGKSIDKLDVLKLIYLADRYHLRKYGRPVTGDSYYAMELGPVPSRAKNVCDKPEYLTESERDFAFRFLSIVGHVIHSKSGQDKEYFCPSEKEALEAAYRKGILVKKRKESLPDFTHRFPEWKKYEANLSNETSSCEMDMLDFFLPLAEKESQHEYCDIPSRLLERSQQEYLDNLAFERFIGQ